MNNGYVLSTAREQYSVTADGLIGRPSIGLAPSGQWKIRGAARFNNFGWQVEFVPFPQCMRLSGWTHKNGKPRYRICDTDHGTDRIWGEAVRYAYETA